MPESAEAYYNLGVAYSEKGMSREAKDNLLKYLELKPDAPNAAEVRTFLKSVK